MSVCAPDREHMRDDVRRALDALGARWCDGQATFEGMPEPLPTPKPVARVAPLTLWDPQ